MGSVISKGLSLFSSTKSKPNEDDSEGQEVQEVESVVTEIHKKYINETNNKKANVQENTVVQEKTENTSGGKLLEKKIGEERISSPIESSDKKLAESSAEEKIDKNNQTSETKTSYEGNEIKTLNNKISVEKNYNSKNEFSSGTSERKFQDHKYKGVFNDPQKTEYQNGIDPTQYYRKSFRNETHYDVRGYSRRDTGQNSFKDTTEQFYVRPPPTSRPLQGPLRGSSSSRGTVEKKNEFSSRAPNMRIEELSKEQEELLLNSLRAFQSKTPIVESPLKEIRQTVTSES